MRSKTGSTRKARHKKVLKRTKGFRMTKSRLYKVAKEASLHADQYSFHGRKLRKRNFRRLWIQRIQAALTDTDLTYSKFIKKLIDNKVELNRKILAELAVNHMDTFKFIVKKLK